MLEFGADLLLFDVMMPGMDGPTTLEELHKLSETSESPAVFMTANAQAHEGEELEAQETFDVVIKPFDPIGLPEQIRENWKSRHD